MKIIVTGSLGNISKPLTQELVAKGHQVVVISSKSDKQKAIAIQAAETLHWKRKLTEILSKLSYGKTSIKEMEDLMDRDSYMRPEEAIEYGLIDKVISSRVVKK